MCDFMIYMLYDVKLKVTYSINLISNFIHFVLEFTVQNLSDLSHQALVQLTNKSKHVHTHISQFETLAFFKTCIVTVSIKSYFPLPLYSRGDATVSAPQWAWQLFTSDALPDALQPPRDVGPLPAPNWTIFHLSGECVNHYTTEPLLQQHAYGQK